MESSATQVRGGMKRVGVTDPRPTAGDCYVCPHRIEVFSKAQMQRALTIRLRVIQGPFPTRIRTGRGHSNHILGPRWSDVHYSSLLSDG